MAALVNPTPLPRGIVYVDGLDKRQGFLDSIFGGGGDTNTAVDSTTSTTTTPTTTPTSTSTTTSTTPTSTSTSTTAETTSTRTTASTQTLASTTTSNGVVLTTTIVTETPVVVTQTSAASTAAASDKSRSSSNGGLIGGVVGGVVGGLGLLTLLALAFILWRRRKARTGHGWFLCFGRKPDRKNDWDVDWPTFDPSSGAAGVGGTFGETGAGAGRRKSGTGVGGTLPNVDANESGMENYGYYPQSNGYTQPDEMRDVGSYAGTAAPSYQSPTSESHYRQNSQQWHMAPMTSFSNAAHSEAQPSVPDYSHLDAPEVREERAREQAQKEAQAQALAAAAAAGGFSRGASTSPPPMASPSFGNVSPPPPAQSPHMLSDHRLSQGTTQMLADNNFFLPHDESGTLNTAQSNHQQRLQLHNPDA